jgi:hypothetical protein
MPAVYVTQEKARKVEGQWVSEFDITPALEFGKVEILMPPGYSFFSPVPVIRALRDKLKDFSDDDYLLPIGDPSIMVAAAMIAGEKNGGRVKLLKWDRFQQAYIPVQLDTTGKAV